VTHEPPFSHVVADEAALRALYREPSPIAAVKDRPTIDDATRRFLERARFVSIGTVGADGSMDVSPKGGPAGFVQVLDERRIAICDLNGNNRLDGITNILATNRVGLCFVVPGVHETVRLNGRAWLTTDPDVLARFTSELRPPKAAIGVEVETTYVHCGKAFFRSQLWEPATWTPEESPDGAEIMVEQGAVPLTLEESRARLDESYAISLAKD
jgi:PPOX class probable FMN-dependent enzyme